MVQRLECAYRFIIRPGIGVQEQQGAAALLLSGELKVRNIDSSVSEDRADSSDNSRLIYGINEEQFTGKIKFTAMGSIPAHPGLDLAE